jgi:hypothetical protein
MSFFGVDIPRSSRIAVIITWRTWAGWLADPPERRLANMSTATTAAKGYIASIIFREPSGLAFN